MAAYHSHVFICENRRDPGHARGSCAPAPDAENSLRSAFKTALKQSGLARTTRANSAGCLDQCEHGPVVVIDPQGIWYGRVQIEDVPRIVQQTIVQGDVLPDLLIDDDCLNNPDCPHRGRRSPA
jgi:(2Fe-2S) ferredoxin